MAEPKMKFEQLLESEEAIGVITKFENDNYAVVDWDVFCDWLGQIEDAHNDEIDVIRKISEREVVRKALERLIKEDE